MGLELTLLIIWVSAIITAFVIVTGVNRRNGIRIEWLKTFKRKHCLEFLAVYHVGLLFWTLFWMPVSFVVLPFLNS